MHRVNALRYFSAVTSAAGGNLPSFTRGLFKGELATASLFPYPPMEVMKEEERETLKMLVEPSKRFFSEVNNAAANDETASIPDETYAGLRELGAYGMQVRKISCLFFQRRAFSPSPHASPVSPLHPPRRATPHPRLTP